MKINKRLIMFVTLDMLLLLLSIAISFLLRFDFNIPEKYLTLIVSIWPYFAACVVFKILAMMVLGIYKRVLSNAGVDILNKVVISIVVSNIICILPIFFLNLGLPRSIPLLIVILDLAFLLAYRFFWLLLKVSIKNFYVKKKNRINTLIVGGGSAGAIIIKELKSNIRIEHYPIGIIDDDPEKKGKYISGVEVLGDRHDIEKIVKKYDVQEIVITIPSAKSKDIREIIEICSTLKVKIKTLPSLQDMINSKVQYTLARDINLEDFLGRNEITINNEAISNVINNKSILVTGAGGSIGSEIVKTVINYSPRNITLLDFYESGVYELSVHLKHKYPMINIDIAICSIQEYDLLDEIFSSKKPDVVFHAAAHKHVPLMEEYPKQALRNNILGTYNVAALADKYECERFVMISTDKAVNPTNIMGATKQFAEKIVNSFSCSSSTLFSVVRFGNVLGSNGSVIPIFKHQIEHGGPVTVTHKEVIRYFMTIPEAACLVIEAVSMSKGGETFVLNMGEPVQLYELAKKMIRFYGYTPGEDIMIEITGLRQGEKLYEELLMSDETLKKTYNSNVLISDQKTTGHEEIMKKLESVKALAHEGSTAQIKAFLKENVDGYLNQ